jgi:hypothetical protein
MPLPIPGSDEEKRAVRLTNLMKPGMVPYQWLGVPRPSHPIGSFFDVKKQRGFLEGIIHHTMSPPLEGRVQPNQGVAQTLAARFGNRPEGQITSQIAMAAWAHLRHRAGQGGTAPTFPEGVAVHAILGDGFIMAGRPGTMTYNGVDLGLRDDGWPTRVGALAGANGTHLQTYLAWAEGQPLTPKLLSTIALYTAASAATHIDYSDPGNPKPFIDPLSPAAYGQDVIHSVNGKPLNPTASSEGWQPHRHVDGVLGPDGVKTTEVRIDGPAELLSGLFHVRPIAGALFDAAHPKALDDAEWERFSRPYELRIPQITLNMLNAAEAAVNDAFAVHGGYNTEPLAPRDLEMIAKGNPNPFTQHDAQLLQPWREELELTRAATTAHGFAM